MDNESSEPKKLKLENGSSGSLNLIDSNQLKPPENSLSIDTTDQQNEKSDSNSSSDLNLIDSNQPQSTLTSLPANIPTLVPIPTAQYNELDEQINKIAKNGDVGPDWLSMRTIIRNKIDEVHKI